MSVKSFVAVWLAEDRPWGSAAVVINRGHTPEIVHVSTTAYDSRPCAIAEALIQPWGKYYPSIPTGVAWLCVIHGPDSIDVVASTVRGEFGYGFAPVRPARNLGDVIFPYQPGDISEWRPSSAWSLLKGSSNPARYSSSLQQAALQLAAIKTFHAFPDRKDRALGVMGACLFTGQAPGHPVGAHATPPGTDIDVSYYTFGKNNTQIGSFPDTIFNAEGNLNLNFDIALNKFFFETVHRYLPEAVIMVDTRIAQALNLPYLQPDSVPSYNHDKHAHISTGGRIDPNADI